MGHDSVDREGLGGKLDRWKPEQFVGGVIVRAAIATVLWFGFDDALAASVSNPQEFSAWTISQVICMTLFLCVIASTGGIIALRSK